MRILFLSRWFPFPVNNGSKLRVYNLLRALAKQHEVTLLSFVDDQNVQLDNPKIRSLCSDLYTVPWREFDQNSRRARLGFLSWKPRFLLDTYSDQMAGLIRSLLSKKKYDLVVASQLSMASYCSCFDGIPAMFEELELGLFHDEAIHAASLFKRLRLGFTWLKLRTYLARLLKSFRSCTVVSEQECRLFLANFPEHQLKVTVIPNCVHSTEYEGLDVEPVSNQLVFTGPFRYQANYEAMRWFVGDVFPRILREMPEVNLFITGDHAGLPLPSSRNVTLTGYVEDIKSLIASSWVSLAPLLSGGGTRLKILEAMAIGTPVIATSKGAEGLDSTPGEHLLLADSADAFANQVISVLRNRELRDRLAVKGKQLVKEKYNWETVLPRFLHTIENTVG
jgi:glycosyltransferase involved in cell wall biosynthesis